MSQPIWTTPAGSLGNYPFGFYNEIQLVAVPVIPATSVTFALISGSLPDGMKINSSGKIYGIAALVTNQTVSNFVVRATDNLGNIKDRTFSISISGSVIPFFTTASGNILSINDSTWVEFPIMYNNPDPSNPITITLQEGSLPPGIEINQNGLIRGYAEPPIVTVNLAQVVTTVTSIDSSNTITCLSTTNFRVGRTIKFSGALLFGGLNSSSTYYIKSILNATSFTISETQNGPTMLLSSGTGFMTATLPIESIGQPTIRTYTFELVLNSPLGRDTNTYSITVVNQNTPVSQGGPGFSSNTRTPTIYNTRPPTYDLGNVDEFYGYYILPADNGFTYAPSTPAFIGTFQSGNYFAFRVIGHDFDGNNLTYTFANLPAGLTGNTTTGWITGIPVLSSQGVSQFGFSVAVSKQINPGISTTYFNFSYNLANNLSDKIVWITPNNLGSIFNNTLSIKSVKASAEISLEYRITSGNLPPNLTLLSNGEITGYVANQPTSQLLELGTTTRFTFTVQAFSPNYPIINSEKTFTLDVIQKYQQPTDTLYIKCAPGFEDRELINTLLANDTIIPTDALYRPNDIYFGKANQLVYEHAYGIYASDIDEYIAAITKNHYWRKLTLGELKTAVAKDSDNNIIYEVVYSQVIDNLVNPYGTSIPISISWPRPINLNLGPWYTSITDIYTSYQNAVSQNYYTSLTPGFARELYPNSLLDMRNRVAMELGQEYDSNLLPLWMTSQQENGGTLGFTPAWVICYTKPGLANIIKNNIETLWKRPDGTTITLNEINFEIDRFSVDKSLTYNYDKNTTPAAWTGLPSGTPVPSPVDSKDFYVLFPRKTILPNNTQ